MRLSLSHDLIFFREIEWVSRLDSLHHHILDKLVWNLLEQFACHFSQRQLEEVLVIYELHNIPHRRLTLIVDQDHLICVQSLHFVEVFFPEAHNYDGDGEFGHLDDDVLGGLHVVDAPIGEDNLEVVLLVYLF